MESAIKNLHLRALRQPRSPGPQSLRALCLCALLLAAPFLHGCAGTARGKSGSSYSYDPSQAVADESQSRADAWVIVRYPAVIDSDAEDAYFNAYARQVIGGRVTSNGTASIDSDSIARAAVAKSNFYAMTLYQVLSEQLPADTVLLSPHMITLDEQGDLTSRALLATETIPSVLTVDFMTYSFPDPAKIMDAPPLTFGDIVTPLAVVHADHWMEPATNGLLLASTPLLPTAWAQSTAQAEEEFDGRLLKSPIDDARALDFIQFLTGESAVYAGLPVKPIRTGRGVLAAVEDYPLEKIRMDAGQVAAWSALPEDDPFRSGFAQGVGTRIGTALSLIDHDRATFSDRQRLLATFDPELAYAFLAQSPDEGVRARLALAEKLIEAERQFLAAQSKSIYHGVYDGAYGKAMREMISAEYRNLEERRSIARRQNAATAIAVLAAVGAAYAGSEVFDGGSYDAGMALASDALFVGSLVALEAVFATKRLGNQVGESFLAQMAPALNEQVTVQVRLAEGTEEISARDYAEFREQTLALYQSRVRSMTVDIQTDCTFRHPRASSQGRWYGACADGLATGRGFGVIRTDDGEKVEFAGDASSGTANGHGAMIVHSPGSAGARFMEGTFRDGHPHGTVRLVQPGEYSALRRFEDGIDRGRGNEANWQPYRFR